MSTETIHNKQIRWLILLILLNNQRAKVREQGGWLRLAMLQRLLSTQGYDLTKEEIRTQCVFLSDPEIRCLEIKVDGEHAPHIYRYRITARGMQAAEGEIRILGIGLWDQ